MSSFLFVNNFSTTLAEDITSSDTTVTVASAANLPTSLSNGQIIPLTLNDAATRKLFETCYITAINGTTLTILRGMEGTTAGSWDTGDYAVCGPTAGSVMPVPGAHSPTASETLPVTPGLIVTPGTLTADIALTFPSNPPIGAEYTVYGSVSAFAVTVETNVSSGTPGMLLPDGSTVYSWVIPASEPNQGIKGIWDGTNWRCETFGQTVIAPGTESNQAAQVGQISGGLISGPAIIPVEFYGVVDDPDGYHITQNTTAYLSAISSSSGKNAIIHREGLTVILDPITISDPVHLILNGTMQLAASSNANFITLAADNITIEGTGTVNGNSANQQGGTGTVVGGICSNTASGTSTNTPPSSPVPISNILIDGITITECFNWPISLGYMTNGTVRNCTLSNSGNSPQFIFSATDCWFNNNTVYGITDGGFVFYQGNGRCGAIGNNVYECHDGIGVYTNTDTMPMDSNILIANNIVHDNANSGISVTTGGSAPTVNNKNVLIIGNICFNNNTAGGDGLGSIGVVGASGVTVQGNWIQGDGATAAAGNTTISITIDEYSSNIVIDSNTISNVGSAAQNGSAITTAGASGLVVTNNKVFDTNSTPVTASGLSGTCGSKNIIGGNVAMTALAGDFLQVAFASDTIVVGQVNAQGAIQFSPSVQVNPATTTGNGLAIGSAAAGDSPTIVAEGSDTDISVVITPKGSGIVYSASQISGASIGLSGSGQIWYSGSGAPSDDSLPVGSLYSNTSGAAGSTFYVYLTSGWKNLA